MRRVAWTVSVAAALVAAPSVAAAAPCGAPDLLDAFPGDGASSVATNAVLSAHYAATAEYRDEDVTLEHVGSGSETLTGMFDAAEGILAVTPAEPLAAGDHYVVTWPRLHGIGTSNRGSGRKVAFRAGSAPDGAPPSFDGLTGIDWDVSRERDECTDSLEDRFTFDLPLGAVSDDGGRASLALVVYQTRGPAISDRDPPVEVLLAPLPPKGKPIRVERALGDASGRACFAALVRDLLGNASGGAEKSVCTTTTVPPFFYGCAAARGGRRGGPGALATLAFMATLLVGRRRRSFP